MVTRWSQIYGGPLRGVEEQFQMKMKIPKMKWSAEVCLVSACALVAADVMPLPGDIERLIRNLVHESRHSGPPPEPTTLSPISATGNVSTGMLTYTGPDGTAYTLMMPPHTHTEYHFPESSSRSISASGPGATALPPIAEFSTNWTPRLFPTSYKAVYPPAMQSWHLGWLDDELVAQTPALIAGQA
jgi:hypothetical protein